MEDDITPADYAPSDAYGPGPSNAPPGVLREGEGEEFDGFIAAGGYGEVYRVATFFWCDL
jgi:hypothetical protein